eukprot:UN32647
MNFENGHFVRSKQLYIFFNYLLNGRSFLNDPTEIFLYTSKSNRKKIEFSFFLYLMESILNNE